MHSPLRKSLSLVHGNSITDQPIAGNLAQVLDTTAMSGFFGIRSRRLGCEIVGPVSKAHIGNQATLAVTPLEMTGAADRRAIGKGLRVFRRRQQVQKLDAGLIQAAQFARIRDTILVGVLPDA